MERSNRSKASVETSLVEIFSSESGAVYTDILVEAGMPVMGRVGKNDMRVIMNDDGEAYVFNEHSVDRFLTELYKQSKDAIGDEAPVGWEKALEKRYSLHPSTTLEWQRATVDVPAGANSSDTVRTRVRVTVQKQNGGLGTGLMFRALRPVPESIEALGLPFQVRELADAHSGLVLVTGPTGAGKTTTIAALVNEINSTRRANIVTIEDPIEIEHARKTGVVTQREVGVDVASFADGVKDALRYVPDVIVIGEIRDADTMRAALRAAESGHLVLASMHAPSTRMALSRALAQLDSAAEGMSFAASLVGIITQSLLNDEHGKKHLAYEVLDAREKGEEGRVYDSIMAAVTEKSPKALSELEATLRQGKLKGSIPMIKSVNELLKRKALDPKRAVSALYSPEDLKEVLGGIAPAGR